MDARLTLPQPERSEIVPDSKPGSSNPTNPRTDQGKDKGKGQLQQNQQKQPLHQGGQRQP
jgi:hypothetical protein